MSQENEDGNEWQVKKTYKTTEIKSRGEKGSKRARIRIRSIVDEFHQGNKSYDDNEIAFPQRPLMS